MSPTGRVAVIIGHQGQDGSILRKLLEDEGTHVVGVGRPSPSVDNDFAQIDMSDVGDVRTLIASVEPTEIYLLAAHHGSSETMGAIPDPDSIHDSWATNVAGVANVLDVLREIDLRAPTLLASSCLIYAPSNSLIDEGAPLRPDTVYGATKAAITLLARAHREQGMPVSTAILFPHESGYRSEKFIASKIARAGLRIAAGSLEEVAIGNLEAVVDWSNADDVVKSMVDLVREAEPNEYIFSSGRASTVFELIEAVSRHVGANLLERVKPRPDSLARKSQRRIGDSSRLQAAVRWAPDRDLDSFAERLVQSHRVHLESAVRQ